jgi:hypothetical protein
MTFNAMASIAMVHALSTMVVRTIGSMVVII